MTKTINDLVVLGRAVPERLKNGRATVCLGGWSPSLGFVRIYPTRLRMGINRWDVISVEVEKTEQDNRLESWKIVGSSSDWNNINNRVKVVRHIDQPLERKFIVENNLSPCVKSINDSYLSLGLIKPKEIKKTYFGNNPQHEEPEQLFLLAEQLDDYEEWAQVKRDYEKEPRLRYVCQDCRTVQGYHDQKVLEWGFYQWMRKNPDNIEQVWENAKFHTEGYDIYLFVGNQAHRRTSFLVISVIRLAHSKERSTWQPQLI